MKYRTTGKLLLLLFMLSQSILSFAQNNEKSVFVLVDLSMNIRGYPDPIDAEMRQDAINFAKSVITATYKKSDFPNWKKTGVSLSPEIKAIINGKGKKMIGVGDFLMIMPFGELKTKTKFQINEIRKYPADFDKYYTFPFSYLDKDTWGNYAEARACNIAYNYKMPEYYIVRIQGKPDDPNSAALDANEQNIVDMYETGAKADVIAKFKHTSSIFSVTIKKMDITKIPGIGKQKKIIIKPENVSRKSLRIVSPKGDINTPFITEVNKIRVSWVCVGCDSTPRYTLKVNNLKTKKTKSYKVKNVNSKQLNLEPSSYKISVSTKGANAKAQYIEIEQESSGSLGFLLLLIILGIAGYFGYKYFMNLKKDKPEEVDEWNNSGDSSPQINEQTTNNDWK